MFDFDRTPEQQKAELERWDGIERRRQSAYTEMYVEQFGPRRKDDGGIRITDEDLQRRCLPSAYAVQQETETRHAETGLPQLQQDYPFGKALLIAGAASFAFWGVIYLILSGGQ